MPTCAHERKYLSVIATPGKPIIATCEKCGRSDLTVDQIPPPIDWRNIQRELIEINETLAAGVRATGVVFGKWSVSPDGQRFRASIREAVSLLAKADIRG